MDLDLKRKKDRERKRKRRRENPEHERELRRAYYRKNAERIAQVNLETRATKREHAVARSRVQRALARGELVRGECEVGGDCFGRIEAHHDDYSRPLDVRWICKGHHMQIHASYGRTPH